MELFFVTQRPHNDWFYLSATCLKSWPDVTETENIFVAIPLFVAYKLIKV